MKKTVELMQRYDRLCWATKEISWRLNASLLMDTSAVETLARRARDSSGFSCEEPLLSWREAT
jgi:hypothetical protein